MSKDQILLFSGGIDSYAAWYFLGRPKTIYFNLRTPYSDYELRVVKELIPETIIDNSLTLNSRQIPGSDTAFIPMRNLYLAMLASAYADEIVICGLKDDCVNDKTPEAFAEFSGILSKLNEREIKVTSPFWNMTKADVVKWYLDTYKDSAVLSSKLLRTISCYTPSSKGKDIQIYCGKCRSCFRKWSALYVNGIKLPFYNLDLMREYLIRARQNRYIPERNKQIIESITSYGVENELPYLGKIAVVDIDGVLTWEIDGFSYCNRTANRANIENINKLREKGAAIVLWTSRYPEDAKITEVWLQAAGVRYDELCLGKRYYDFWVDDKGVNINDITDLMGGLL